MEGEKWKPYVENVNNSVPLLNLMESRIHSYFLDSVKLLGTRIIEILGGFTSFFQPCDVGIMKPFKSGFVYQCQDLKVKEYARLGSTGKISSPGCVEIREFLDIMWNQFPTQTVRNSFKKIWIHQ